MRKYRIRIAESADFSQEVKLKLEKNFEVDMSPCSQEQISGILQDYDVFWFRLAYNISKEDLAANIRCKVIAVPVTGIDHIDADACKNSGITVISLKGESSFLRTIRATAEHTILLTLMVLRNAVSASQSVRGGAWNRDLFRGNEIYGKTVGIIGLGRLGEIVASYFQSMGARVVGFDKHSHTLPDIHRMDSMNELARQSDIVSIHLSLNPSTLRIIDESFFQSMKKGSVLVNTSRGGIVDEQALLKALKSKWIKAAALDVLQGEQASLAENELIRFAKTNDNLLITPHIGGNTYESFYKTEHFIADKIISFFGV